MIRLASNRQREAPSNMAKRTLAPVIALLLVLSLALAACGGKGGKETNPSSAPAAAVPAESGDTAPSEKPKEVSFTSGYATGDPATKQAIGDTISAFMQAYPHIKIKDVSEGTTSSYLDWVKTKDAVG